MHSNKNIYNYNLSWLRWNSRCLLFSFWSYKEDIFNVVFSSYYITGEDAPISELVDFIFAAQIAENTEKDVDCPNYCDEGMNEVWLIQYIIILILLGISFIAFTQWLSRLRNFMHQSKGTKFLGKACFWSGISPSMHVGPL